MACLDGACGIGNLLRGRECEGKCNEECVGNDFDSDQCCFDFSECGKITFYLFYQINYTLA